MFKCWSCGSDYPDVPYATKAEANQWEERAAYGEREKIVHAIDNYRRNLIESYNDFALTEEHQQGLLDGLKLALVIIGK